MATAARITSGDGLQYFYSLDLPIHLSFSFSLYGSRSLAPSLSVSLYLSINLSIYLSTYLVLSLSHSRSLARTLSLSVSLRSLSTSFSLHFLTFYFPSSHYFLLIALLLSAFSAETAPV